MSLNVYINCIIKTLVYDSNITHNLGGMAEKAGIYQHLWRPEELKLTKVSELIKPLTKALKNLQTRPDYYKQFNSPNGWGKYENFVEFVSDYLTQIKDSEYTLFFKRPV